MNANMETIVLDRDMWVMYVKANSFPDDIAGAHQRLHAIVPFSANRKYFGISRPENDVIVYLAAAEMGRTGEEEEYGLNALRLNKGRYLCITVHDYMKDLLGIGKAFQQLLQQPGLDPQGYCVEWYMDDKGVTCMIRLA
jgi:hypothetical protein